MITVTVQGTTPAKLKMIVEGVVERCTRGTADVAHETRNEMVGYIKAGYMGRGRRDGSSGNLEAMMQVENPTHNTYGIGNIMNLNVVTPYWALLNAGGMVAIKARRVPGYFGENRPPMSAFAGTGVGKEQFTYTPRGQKDFSGPGLYGGRQFLMVVNNPIGAVNYIEKTMFWLSVVMKVKFGQWTRTQGYARK